MKAPATFSEVVSKFPDRHVLADELGIPERTVASWMNKKRDYVPAIYWQAIVDAARRLPDVPRLSMETMRRLGAAKEAERDAERRARRANRPIPHVTRPPA